ncbi:MAG: MurT ligase domain-containing protein [Candidatus Saccharimonadales bacterium]
MMNFLATLTGKAIRFSLGFRRDGGHALPGLVVGRLFPNYVSSMLAKFPDGVIIITGTNGKTTTTKIVTQLLQANGKKVLTNPTGSNLIRGIASSLAAQASILGKLNYDIAILEVDEATARQLVSLVKPRWVLALNVSRDQLDRFGEIDTVAAYVGAAMEQATEGVVTNTGDPHLLQLSKKIKKPLHYFGAAASLNKYFPSDYELAAVDKPDGNRASRLRIDVELADFKGQKVNYQIDGQKFGVELKLSGQHNFLNGAAALALCRQLLPDVNPKKLVDGLSKISLAFGRGEKYRLKNGAEIELVLVKNPASFTQALSSYNAKDASLMIAINDKIADGRDVSWLWDVNFQPLDSRKVFLTSGTRAADMALRLNYDDIKTEYIEPNLFNALKLLSQQPKPKVVLSTYTAMLQLYKVLSKQGEKMS